MRYAAAYIATIVVFLGLDYIWLGRIAHRLYSDALGPLLLDRPRLGAAAAFYALYVVGILVFAVFPALKSGSAAAAFFSGAFLGLLAYATYDMTNYATLKGWPLHLALLDMGWGALLTGTSATAGWLAARFAISAGG